MPTCQIPDPGRLGQFTQPCPACDGLLPAEAVTMSKWKPAKAAEIGACLTRTVSMHCPHCDYRQQRQEFVPELAFWNYARLIGDR